MKVVILDGSQANDAVGECVRKVFITQLQSYDWEVEHIVLREQKIGNCAGDFFCWVRSPGICHINDDNRRIAQTIITSDLVIYLTPVTFGGYSSTLKKMVDHQIQNISPHFVKVAGETHHQKRYDRYPDFLVIGWMDKSDVQSEAVFKHLVKRNAINFYAERAGCEVITADQSDDEIATSIKNSLDDLNNKQIIQNIELPEIQHIPNYSTFEIQRALLLIGSPKTSKSTSNTLGEYLFKRLGSQDIETEKVYLHTIVHSNEKMKALMDTVDAVDLVTLAFPLYVDSLPSPVIDTFEQISVHRQSQKHPHGSIFNAISNCGFPEASQIDNALAICEIFAEQAGFQWAGGLALGGGHGLGDKPLEEWGGRTANIRKALDLAADTLAHGKQVTNEAQALMSKPLIPSWFPFWAYRLIGGFGWKQQAKQYGMHKSLDRQPYTDI
jgi:multimeric flavodoxin WrbA